MKHTILALLLVPAMVALSAIVAVSPAYACGSSPAAQDVAGGVGQTGTTPSNCGTDAINNAISTAVQILSLVVGAVSIIAIVLGGFKYITSGGDSNKVANAKNTIIYAMVGLAVAVLAQVIVNVVLTQSNNAAIACPSGQHRDSSNNCVKN